MRFSYGVCGRSVGNSVTRTAVLSTRGVVSGRSDSLVVTALRGVLSSLRENTLSFSFSTRSVRVFIRDRLAGHVNSINGELRATEDHGSRITISVELCLESRSRRIVTLVGNLVGTVCSITTLGGSAVLPKCARLRHTRPVAFTRRVLTCNVVLSHSVNEVRSTIGHVGLSPLNSYTLTNAACGASHCVATRGLKFSNVALGDVSNISSESFYIRLLSYFTALVVRLSHFSRRVVL